jgi:hypothetical protein
MQADDIVGPGYPWKRCTIGSKCIHEINNQDWNHSDVDLPFFLFTFLIPCAC